MKALATAQQPAADRSTSQPTGEPKPFVISSLDILRMSQACLSAQEISDALEREGTIHPDEIRGVRHER